MSLPQWKGLWDWSMRYADGTGPSGFNPEDVDPAKMKWLEEALKHYMIDFAARMREIKDKLQQPGGAGGGRESAGAAAAAAPEGGEAGEEGGEGAAADLEEREALLDELMDIVGSIDFAKDLHKIGGLPVLLDLLASPHPSLRWRAAEVVATCVANNPPVQQWFLEGGVLPPLLALTAPAQPPTVRAKALLALSGLVRHSAPGLQAVREAGGLAAVVGCLGHPDRRLARRAMTNLAYMLGQRPTDCAAAARQGALSHLVSALGTGSGAETSDAETNGVSDTDLRQAALGALLQLAAGGSETWAAIRDAPGLRNRLDELAAAHAGLAAEEREAQEEELDLLTRLQGILSAAAAPAAAAGEEVSEGPGGGDHVSVEAYEAAGQDLKFTVNEPNQAAAAAAAARDAERAGAAGQGGQQEPAAAAAPLLLGPP